MASNLAWNRALLLVARAAASGCLVVSAHGREARIELCAGRVVAFDGELGPRIGELVGDRARSAGEQLWGARSVAEGRVPRNKLAYELRRQMRLRARELTLWGDASVVWREGVTTTRPFTDPMDPCDLVAEAMRHASTGLAPEPLREGERLSQLGAWWAERAALHPHEVAALHHDSSERGRRWIAAVRAAGLVEVPVTDEARELSRVHSLWRRGGTSAVLGAVASENERRRALRRVALSVHPDRFADDPRLGSVSSDLVARLTSR